MQTKIDKILPYAFEALDTMLQDRSFEGCIPRPYNGYIASLGASVIQSGMMAALVFNHNQDANSEANKLPLMNVLYRVVLQMRGEQQRAINLVSYYREAQDKQRLKRQILDAANALKLAIRTYPKSEPTL